MGLDMYLEAEFYQSAVNYDADGKPVKTAAYKSILKKMGIAAKELAHVGLESYTISLRIGYWRKANAIHSWFVKNVQIGVDDCKSYYVDSEKLEELKELCEKVLQNPESAKDLLPTQSGFFFGATEYGEWYMEDIKTTIKILDFALSDKLRGTDIYYRSSW